MSLLVNDQNWPVFANRIAAPSPPDEHNEAAIERLVDYISPWIVDVKNVRPQFKAINRVLMIDFETPQQKKYYDLAYERYLAEVARLQASDNPNSPFMILVEWLKFRQAAEFLRAPWLARQMYHAVQEGFAAGCATNFKATTAKVTLELNQKFKVPRKLISIVWGGDAIYAGTERAMTDEEMSGILTQYMAGEPVSKALLMKCKKQLQAMNAGLGSIPKEMDLGPQNFVKRQEEIDRFQRGEALYSLFNFKSGGVGLSLHHSDQMTKEKCRRKPNGYVVEEDIPNIPTRPRRAFIAPTYSAIELVQGLGRYPRIASLSDTLQTLVYYRGTIEGMVAAVTSQKLRCLSKVVRQRESWEDLILKNHKVSADIPSEDIIEDKDNELFNLDVGEGEEDEDNE